MVNHVALPHKRKVIGSNLECCSNCFPGNSGIPVPFDSPSLINFDHTYHMLSPTNFQSDECDEQFTAILNVCFILLVCFCRFQWHLIYIFSVFPHKIFKTWNYFPEITSPFLIISRNPANRELRIAAIDYSNPS